MSASASRQPEQARLRIARLRARRDGARLEEAEAERREAVEVRGVLVEAGGEADAIREVDAHHARPGRAAGEVRREARDARAARPRRARANVDVVRALGIEREERGRSSG